MTNPIPQVGVTETQMQEAIRSAISRTQNLLTTTMQKLETKLTAQVQSKLDLIDSRVSSVDTRTKEDIQRLDRKLDEKIGAMDDKLDVQAVVLARIEGMLSQQKETWDMMSQKQRENNERSSRNQLGLALVQSNQVDLMFDIHGSQDKPNTPSIMGILKEMSAKTSDVLTMMASTSSRLGDLEETVEIISEKTQYGKRLKSYANQFKAPIKETLSSKAGITIVSILALAILLIVSPDTAQPLIDLLTKILGG